MSVIFLRKTQIHGPMFHSSFWQKCQRSAQKQLPFEITKHRCRNVRIIFGLPSTCIKISVVQSHLYKKFIGSKLKNLSATLGRKLLSKHCPVKPKFLLHFIKLLDCKTGIVNKGKAQVLK